MIADDRGSQFADDRKESCYIECNVLRKALDPHRKAYKETKAISRLPKLWNARKRYAKRAESLNVSCRLEFTSCL